MRVLVTGSEGFIGGYLIPRLKERNHEVVRVDRKLEYKGVPFDLQSKITDTLIQGFKPEIVFHLAAEHFVPWCREHPKETRNTNVFGTHQLINSLKTVDELRAFVFASSAAVYGFGKFAFMEQMPPKPVDIYGQTKAEAEKGLWNHFRGRPAVNLTILRLSNVIGPGDKHEHVLTKIANGDGEITLGNMWPRRDYVYAGDVADAMLGAAGLGAGRRTLNVGTGVGTSVLDLVYAWDAVHGVTTKVNRVKGRDGDGHLVLDPEAAYVTMGFEARTEIKEVLALWK